MYFDILLKIHLIAVAFWFGILGAELIIERTRAKSKIHSQIVAYQHYWIDLLFLPHFDKPFGFDTFSTHISSKLFLS